MQIVIKITKKVYDRYRKAGRIKMCDIDIFEKALNNGVVLPKGHGRLIDADELIKQLEVMANDEWNKQVGSSKGLEDVIDIVDDISPIIEAD